MSLLSTSPRVGLRQVSSFTSRCWVVSFACSENFLLHPSLYYRIIPREQSPACLGSWEPDVRTPNVASVHARYVVILTHDPLSSRPTLIELENAYTDRLLSGPAHPRSRLITLPWWSLLHPCMWDHLVSPVEWVIYQLKIVDTMDDFHIVSIGNIPKLQIRIELRRCVINLSSKP